MSINDRSAQQSSQYAQEKQAYLNDRRENWSKHTRMTEGKTALFQKDPQKEPFLATIDR